VRSSIFRARSLAAFLAVATTLTLSAPPASAADRPAAHGTGTRLSLATATAAHVAALRPAPAAFAQEAPAAVSSESGSFFRSRTGVAAVVLMVAGAGYVAYSIGRDNKKVHSPIR
jgi:hypothetical protein